MQVIISVLGRVSSSMSVVCLWMYVCFTAFCCLTLLVCVCLWVSLLSSQTPSPSPERYFALLKEVSGCAGQSPLPGWLGYHKAFPTHTGYFLHPQKNDKSGIAVLRKAGFLFPKTSFLFSLILTHIPTSRYVVAPVSWLWLHFSRGQTHLTFLFLLLSQFP